MAERDVVDIEQHLVLALFVPDLATGVTRVGDDDPHRRLRPGPLFSMTVAGRVGRRGARHTFAGEFLGDVEQAPALEELGEDPFHHQRVHRMRNQPPKALAVGRLGGVGVRPGVEQLVPIGWAPAEVAAFGRGDRGHGRADPDLDPVPLSLGQPPEDPHDHVVGFVGRVDRPADLGNPQRHIEVLKQREGQRVLVAVEGTVRFPHDNRIEVACWVLELLDQRRGVRTASPGNRSGLVHVEEFGGDRAAFGFDERPGPAKLPGTRGRRVLVVLGRDAPIEREPKNRRYQQCRSRRGDLWRP